jgi:Protein of unknown function (DUF2591)
LGSHISFQKHSPPKNCTCEFPRIQLEHSIKHYWVGQAQLQDRPAAAAIERPMVLQPFSTDLKLGEPIISRERILISHIVDSELGDKAVAQMEVPAGQSGLKPEGNWPWLGITDLEAAMRCYVASRFGHEVPRAS